MNTADHLEKEQFLLCSDCEVEIRVGDWATIIYGEDGKMGAVYCRSCSTERKIIIPDEITH